MWSCRSVAPGAVGCDAVRIVLRILRRQFPRLVQRRFRFAGRKAADPDSLHRGAGQEMRMKMTVQEIEARACPEDKHGKKDYQKDLFFLCQLWPVVIGFSFAGQASCP